MSAHCQRSQTRGEPPFENKIKIQETIIAMNGFHASASCCNDAIEEITGTLTMTILQGRPIIQPHRNHLPCRKARKLHYSLFIKTIFEHPRKLLNRPPEMHRETCCCDEPAHGSEKDMHVTRSCLLQEFWKRMKSLQPASIKLSILLDVERKCLCCVAKMLDRKGVHHESCSDYLAQSCHTPSEASFKPYKL